MSMGRECPFCGNLHVRVASSGKTTMKTFVECPRCKARGPVNESLPTSYGDAGSTAINEAAARWDDRVDVAAYSSKRARVG